MIERKAVISNGAGIHCRPAAVILKEVRDYDGEIIVSASSGSCRLTSVMELLVLCLEQGTEVSVAVEGENEEYIAARLVELFERIYDFPPQ